MSARKIQIPTAEVFVPLLQPARDKSAFGGRGSGKSHFFGGLMVEDCLAAPGDTGEGMRALCIREVQKDLSQSAKALIEKKISDLGLGEQDGFRAFKDVIQTPGDGIIIFKGMNDYSADSVKSLEGFTRAWWEEAHTATARSVMLLRPTMRAPGAQMWWSWNPSRKTDPIDKMMRGPERPTGAIVVEASWRDNPWFTAELEQERQDCKRITPDDYAHVWDGDYVTVVTGAYFASHLATARQENRIGNLAADPLLEVRAYWDIGGTGARADATAIWLVQFVGREIRVLDYYEASGQPLAVHAAWLREHGVKTCVLPHDGASNDKVYDVSYESALTAAGFEVVVIPNQGKGAAAARVEAARRLFPQCWFDAVKCEAGLDALGWYHERKDDKRGIGLGPEHDWASHGADAFGLMCVAYEQHSARPTDASKFRIPKSSGWMGR